ncbi:MAG: BrnA antitoxin family protein, partial [Patescibacteria group bacterium]
MPKFKNETAERNFWASHSPLDYLDASTAIVNPEFPNLKFSNKTISLRLPESLLNRIKAEANKRDVPYQSYIKILLAEKVKG